MLSDHALERASKWNLSYDEIVFVTQHGHREYTAGCIFCQLRDEDIPDHLPGNHPYRRLAGNASVLLCSVCNHVVITLYRNDRAFSRDRQKTKYDRRICNRRRCPACN